MLSEDKWALIWSRRTEEPPPNTMGIDGQYALTCVNGRCVGYEKKDGEWVKFMENESSLSFCDRVSNAAQSGIREVLKRIPV